MKRLFLILIVLCISVWLGANIATDPGYILMARGKSSIEMPLWFAMVLMFGGFGIFYGVIRLWRNFRNLPHYLHTRSFRRRNKNAETLTKQGLLLLAEDKLAAAEKKLLRGISYNNMPWVNYLVAAYIAATNNDVNKINTYLAKANEIAPEAHIAINLAQAHFYFEQQQWEQALVILKQLHTLVPRHTKVLNLLAEIYWQLKDWSSLLKMFSDLRKYQVFSSEKITDLEIQTYCGLFLQAASCIELQKRWQSMARDLKENPNLIHCYVELLIKNHAHDEAEKLINKILSKVWNSNLVDLYGRIKSKNMEQQLRNAEMWLRSYPNDSVLLLTAGRLCVVNQLWGKARNYFESSIRYNPQPKTYEELGMLLEQLGESIKAKDCYIQGLKLALQKKS